MLYSGLQDITQVSLNQNKRGLNKAIVTKQLWAMSNLAAVSFFSKSHSDCLVTAVTSH